MIAVRVLLTMRQGLHRTHNVHTGSQGGAQVKQHPQRPPDLHAQRPRYDVIRSAGLYRPVGRDGAEGEGGDEGGNDANRDDGRGGQGPGLSGDGGQSQEEDDADDLSQTGQEDAVVGVQFFLVAVFVVIVGVRLFLALSLLAFEIECRSVIAARFGFGFGRHGRVGIASAGGAGVVDGFCGGRLMIIGLFAVRIVGVGIAENVNDHRGRSLLRCDDIMIHGHGWEFQ